jgi:hypothetical protein
MINKSGTKINVPSWINRDNDNAHACLVREDFQLISGLSLMKLIKCDALSAVDKSDKSSVRIIKMLG